MASTLSAQEQTETTRLGFWLYLLSDVMLFGALFATFMILRHNIADGPSAAEIIEPPFVFLQTIALLASSFTIAVAVSAARHGRIRDLKLYLLATFIFGALFLALEVMEFAKLIHEGYIWTESAFLSSFFALVGTHGLHITFGLVWLIVWVAYWQKRGLTEHMQRKLGLFALFWHFLDIVWIWIFTIVYMFGVAL